VDTVLFVNPLHKLTLYLEKKQLHFICVGVYKKYAVSSLS